MSNLAGVYINTKKDGTIYYRSNITYKNKHISLGSFSSEAEAHSAYEEAKLILEDTTTMPSNYSSKYLSFEKCIVLFNFRDHNIYFKNPIYIMNTFFFYYYDKDTIFTFDIDDLFFYSTHKIMKRGRHLFVADYGMQINILNRYGIRNFGVEGKDYYFANNDSNDFRYSNVICINPYTGVEQVTDRNGLVLYKTKIHIHGNYVVGTYKTLTEAAIAYNKAVDSVKKQGFNKNYSFNYIEGITPSNYAKIYSELKISEKLTHLII